MNMLNTRHMAALFAIAAFLPLQAAAEGTPALSQSPFAELQNLQRVSDSTLAEMRGKYVPPGSSSTSKLAVGSMNAPAPTNAALLPASVGSVSTISSPLQGFSSGGSVVFFGLHLESTWNVQDNGATRGVAVGADVGINLSNDTVTTGTWSSSTNGGLPADSPTNNAVTGAPPAENVSSGIGQSIQVAGNGNSISNQATVQVGPDASGPATLPATNTCGADCAATIANNAVNISIATAQGTVQQSIGANGILQSAQIMSDMNRITNQLGVQIRLGSAPTFNPGSLLPIITTLPVIH